MPFLSLAIAAVMAPTGSVHAQMTPKMQLIWSADSARRLSVLTSVQGELTRLGLVKWSIPEYHDEQRFPVWTGAAPTRSTISPQGATFGPVVNIFASAFLDDFSESKPWQFYEHGARGVMVAAVYVDAPPNAPLPIAYAALRLAAGMNCLWLAHPTAGEWSASISRAQGGQCSRTLPPNRYHPLSVRRLVTNGANGAAYASVARFGENNRGQPTMGTKCLDGWCEIGPVGTNWGMVPVTAPTSIPVRGISGWYDEQWIAEPSATGTLKPFMYASVFPALDIASHSAQDYATPQAVAVVVLPVDPPATSRYYRWGLRAGENVVYLRERTPGRFRLRIGSGPNAKWLNAERMTHMDAGVPGTARWRYVSSDDGIWVPCGQACCRVDDS
jgi:hypothetical protein